MSENAISSCENMANFTPVPGWPQLNACIFDKDDKALRIYIYWIFITFATLQPFLSEKVEMKFHSQVILFQQAEYSLNSNLYKIAVYFKFYKCILITECISV